MQACVACNFRVASSMLAVKVCNSACGQQYGSSIPSETKPRAKLLTATGHHPPPAAKDQSALILLAHGRLHVHCAMVKLIVGTMTWSKIPVNWFMIIPKGSLTVAQVRQLAPAWCVDVRCPQCAERAKIVPQLCKALPSTPNTISASASMSLWISSMEAINAVYSCRTG